jgi:uncharacterized OB-fold protein
VVTASKYVPRPEGLHLEFHRLCASSATLHIQRCRRCGLHRHPPRWYCASCHSSEHEFAPVSGSGVIYSLLVNHFTVDPGWIDDVPYVTAVVELREGPRVIASVDQDLADLHIGQDVHVEVEPRGEDFAYLFVQRVDTK